MADVGAACLSGRDRRSLLAYRQMVDVVVNRPNDYHVKCVMCGEALDVNSRYGVQRKIEGWEELRRDGGANKIVGRNPTGEWRHTACAYHIPGQDTLFPSSKG